jgi:hypothetical protein
MIIINLLVLFLTQGRVYQNSGRYVVVFHAHHDLIVHS